MTGHLPGDRMLSYRTEGAGPAVLLLHSGATDARMWHAQQAALARSGWRVVAPDLRGYGRTPAADADWSDAEDVRDLLDALGVDRAAVVGSSFGGWVALEVAARWPERVDRLVLLCPAVAGMQRSPELARFGERENDLLEAGDVDAATELNVATWLGPEADDSTRELVATMQRHAFTVQLAAAAAGGEPEQRLGEVDLAQVRVPTLVVSGAHDLGHFRAVARHLAGTLPAVRHLELGWAGHLPSLERPAEVTALLLDELTTGTAGAGRPEAPRPHA